MTPELSVVVPTFNRKDTVLRVLEGLQRQTLPAAAFEVLVVDDGSRDGSAEALKRCSPKFDFSVTKQENSGPAGARNRGIRAARGPIVVFLGDDTVPEPDFLEVHLRSHRESGARKISVLGYTGWPRERRITPFLHHINEYGLQFGYELIEDPESVPFNFFYTSNISVPRQALLEAGLFDTTFPDAAWEDIELSYRLARHGYVIVYRPGAVVRHHHEITFDSFRRRQERSGRAAAIFYRKHPELADFLGVGSARVERTGASLPLRIWAGLCQRWEIPGGRRAIDRVLRADYLRGLKSALSDAP
ncbi:MAG: glycosyltransferase family 2 protein [Thermoanaerobaculia bacterium]